MVKSLPACFNHPSPYGLGHLSVAKISIRIKVSIIPTREGWVKQAEKHVRNMMAVSIIPTREGWVPSRQILVNPRTLFQSSRPARAGSVERAV